MGREKLFLAAAGFVSGAVVMEFARHSHPRPPLDLKEKPIEIEPSGESGIIETSGGTDFYDTRIETVYAPA